MAVGMEPESLMLPLTPRNATVYSGVRHDLTHGRMIRWEGRWGDQTGYFGAAKSSH